jgi:hypothetical protein
MKTLPKLETVPPPLAGSFRAHTLLNCRTLKGRRWGTSKAGARSMRLWIVFSALVLITASPVPAISDNIDWRRYMAEGGCEFLARMIKLKGKVSVARDIFATQGCGAAYDYFFKSEPAPPQVSPPEIKQSPMFRPDSPPIQSKDPLRIRPNDFNFHLKFGCFSDADCVPSQWCLQLNPFENKPGICTDRSR